MSPPTAPPASCPIGWQPEALAPVFYGARSLGAAEGAPVPLRIFFPSLDGAVETAPLLEGCGRYPLVLFAHGHCQGDTQHYLKWFRLPAQLARAGYVVVVPYLTGNAGGQSPSVSSHPDEATLDAVLGWARSQWVGAATLMPAPATGVVGHSYGAMLGARFAVGRKLGAYVGLSGGWLDWFGDEPFPLPLMDLPTLLTFVGPFDFSSQLSDATWQQMKLPRHRIDFPMGEHWDYIAPATVTCGTPGSCAHLGSAVADLVTMFLGRYLPPELATDLPERIPATLEPPALALTFAQQFFAGGYLGGYAAMASTGPCEMDVKRAVERLVANTRSKETHSLDHPCAWVSKIAASHRWLVTAKPAGYNWCDFCFRGRADG